LYSELSKTVQSL